MPTATSPPANTGTFLDDIRGLLIDTARFKLIDQERIEDDRNLPDQTDLRNGFGGNPQVGSGGFNVVTLAKFGLAALVLFGVAKATDVI